MYRNILVPVDGSSTANLGLSEAVRLARLTHGRLRLLHSVDELSFLLAAEGYATSAGDIWTVLRTAGTKVLEQAAALARAQGVEAETVLCDSLKGPLHELVAAEAAKWPADLIVIGTHGRRGMGRLLLGSDAEKILRSAAVPVLLVRETDTAARTPAADAAPATRSLQEAVLP